MRNLGGRPRIAEYDNLAKTCPICGGVFHLRDTPFQSLGRFLRRKTCSRECASASQQRRGNLLGRTFWDRLDKNPSSCWEWRGKLSHNGYGQLEHKGRSWRAHRLAYTLAKGKIPAGMMVLHSCDNRRCCNPKHLRIGTAKDNWQDAIERNRLHPKQIDKFFPKDRAA